MYFFLISDSNLISHNKFHIMIDDSLNLNIDPNFDQV